MPPRDYKKWRGKQGLNSHFPEIGAQSWSRSQPWMGCAVRKPAMQEFPSCVPVSEAGKRAAFLLKEKKKKNEQIRLVANKPTNKYQ